MRKRHFLTAFLCAGIFLSPVSAHNSSIESIKLNNNQDFLFDFVHKVYTTADGLPGMSLTSVIQDSKGYIWIGTYDGLVRFDGVEFTVFSRYTDSKYDFAGGKAIFEDSCGNLWIGHNDEGLSCIKKNGEIFKYTTENGLPNNRVSAICEDKNGNIWIGTGKGLCNITPDEILHRSEEYSVFEKESIDIIGLLCDSQGRIWVTTGSENELFVISEGKIELYRGITKIKNPTVRGICEASDGAMWFGADPHYAVRIKDGTETIYDVSHKEIDATALDKITEDRHGRIWFSTDAGLTILHDDVFTYYDSYSGSPDNGFGKVLEDREGNFWIPYNRGGLEKLSQGKFRTIPMETSVNSICEDTEKKIIWLGTDKGIFAYKDNHFIENELTEILSGSRVRNVEITKDGELLVSSYSDRAPQVLMTKEGKISIWNEENGFKSAKCRVSIKTEKGDYFAGTTKGLFIMNHNEKELKSLNKENGFENEYIMWLFEDEKNQVWVGTNGGGIYILADDRIARHYGTEDGLSGNVVFKISEINGKIWITTGTGLSLYDEKTDSFFNFNSKNGLALDNIFQILVDSKNSAWMTTNKGIYSASYSEMLDVFLGKKDRVNVKFYGNSDGLITSGVNSVSCGMIDSTSNVYFPLVDGFALYNPEKSGKNEKAPEIEIQEYIIDNEKYDYYGQPIIIPAGAKRLSVKFTGLTFLSSESISFKTMLEGFDTEYSDWNRARQVSYTNLKHGKYELWIRSQNGDGVESEITSPVQIEKKPFIWEIWWFQAICGISLVLIITLAILNKIRKMRAYQEELEERVEERTQELKIANRNLRTANEKAESLLLNILPSAIATELTENPGSTIAKKYPNVSVIFTDIVSFTKMSGGLKAETIVKMLNLVVTLFDERAQREGIEKIKTIGDAYMAAVGLSETSDKNDTIKMVRYAQGVLEDVKQFNKKHGTNIQIRVGINTGDVVAGVIGKSKFIYDLWGDTVNVASRMESSGQAMKIHVSQETYEQTKDIFKYGEAVEVAVKGKGEMKTYFL